MRLEGTKQTIERFNIQLDSEVVTEDSMIFNFAMKLFYANGKKCLQIIHVKTKLTIILYDVKNSDIKNIDIRIKQEIYKLFKEDIAFTEYLDKFFEYNTNLTFGKLSNRSAISTLNRTERMFIEDLEIFYMDEDTGKVVCDEILHEINFNYFMTITENKKTRYMLTGEEFKETLTSWFR